MCSIADARLALIGQAIDELADEMRRTRAGAQQTGTESTRTGSTGTVADADSVVQRLATLWAMVAELDPGLAERAARYAPSELRRRADPPG
jgi:hypothetical protein